MLGTQTHTKSFKEDIIKHPQIKEYWDMFYESDLRCWLEWHDFWMEKVRTSQVPIFFFRFEDLLQQPEIVLKDLFKFVLAEKNIDGTVIEKRIRETISKGKNYLYKPRSAGQGFHKHANKISEAKMADMMQKLEFYLHFFGYAKDERPEHADSITQTDS